MLATISTTIFVMPIFPRRSFFGPFYLPYLCGRFSPIKFCTHLPYCYKITQGVVANDRILEAEVGGTLQIQGRHGTNFKFQASLGNSKDHV